MPMQRSMSSIIRKHHSDGIMDKVTIQNLIRKTAANAA